MSSTGNATDFGDLNSGNGYGVAGCANSTFALFGGNSTTQNRIESIQIASTGNATDYGDLGYDGGYSAGCSNTHGGL